MAYAGNFYKRSSSHKSVAEEVGLWGSQAIAKDYRAKQIPVHAVLQFDSIGYNYQNENTM